MNTFSQILRSLREDFRITQADLSKKLEDYNIKTSTQNISYWEKGRQPPFETVIALSKIFNVSIDYLIGASPYKNRQEEMELNNITNVLEENIDQRIINTLINTKQVLTTLKEANAFFFDDFISFLSISKEYFLKLSDVSFDIQLQILELKEINYESIKRLISDNRYKFNDVQDIYLRLTKFINSLSAEYKDDLIDNAISQLTLQIETAAEEFEKRNDN